MPPHSAKSKAPPPAASKQPDPGSKRSYESPGKNNNDTSNKNALQHNSPAVQHQAQRQTVRGDEQGRRSEVFAGQYREPPTSHAASAIQSQMPSIMPSHQASHHATPQHEVQYHTWDGRNLHHSMGGGMQVRRHAPRSRNHELAHSIAGSAMLRFKLYLDLLPPRKRPL